jgi:hypothetical protein
MLALNLVGVVFPYFMLGGRQVALVCTPTVGKEAPNAQGLESRFELQKSVILTATKHVRQHLPGAMIKRLPQPAGRFLVPDVRPHFISLGFLDAG